VVFPSIWPEPFGRIVIEAMAAGKMVIASNIGAIKEIVVPSSGILVPAGEHQPLQQGIKDYIKKNKLDQDLANYLENYTLHGVTKRLIISYKRVIQNG